MSTRALYLIALTALLAACSDDAADDDKKPVPADMAIDQDTDPSTDQAEDLAPDMDADMPPADMNEDMVVGPGCVVGEPAGAGQVATTRGLVQGVRVGQTWSYRGIPYAAPPVGPLRWRDPQPHACWDGVRMATMMGAKCPQKDAMGASVGAEDCLTINVWTPDKAAPAGGWPVLFFIHGGGNIQGSSAEELIGGKLIYDGALLAGQDVVVVTMNYRLGALGYLTTPDLDAETPGSGNWGLKDLILALEWTRDNIAAFGGDAGNVMIFGESAGAVNVCALMTAARARGLFHKALMQSGGCFSTPRATAQQDAAAAIAQTSCKDAANKLECLRALPALRVLDELPADLAALASPQLSGGLRTYGPTHGAGALLAVEPLAAITAGNFARVPFVIGTNLDEMANLLGLPANTTAAQYEQIVRGAFAILGAGVADKVLAMYPAADYPTPRDAAVQLYSDLRFTCPARVIARRVRAHSADVWRYFFTRRAVTRNGEVPAQHGIELLYVFGSLNSIPLYVPAPEDRALASAMQRRWAALGRNGDPQDGAEAVWPRYESATDPYLELGTTVRAGAGIHADKCDYFETLVNR